MDLESLANEILLDIFEYLDLVCRFRAFYNLNWRFNALLLNDHQRTFLDFRGISKTDFHLFCEQYLPLFIDCIALIHLPNDDETPNLARFFFSYPFAFNQFVHLQSLSLYDMCSIDMTVQLIERCSQLRRLDLTKFHITYQERTKFSKLLQTIWNLPKLVDCRIKTLSTTPELDMKLTVISTSIEYLTIDDAYFRCDLLELFEYTPNLSRLSLNVFRPSMHYLPQTIFASIVSLDIKLRKSDAPFTFLYSIPNLSRLKFEIYDSPVLGFEWEGLIKSCLPKLTQLQLKMNFSELTPNLERVCIQLLNTFRTSFWLEERQWFVRCTGFTTLTDMAMFYTLPYSFDHIPYRNERWSYSTCPNDMISLTSNHVTNIEASKEPLHQCQDLHLLSQYYPNLHHLSCHLGMLTTDTCLCRPFTNHLTSISIVLFDNSWLLPLQTFFNSSPHLYSLTVFFMLTIYAEIFDLKSSSIRRLNVYRHSLSYEELTYLSENECKMLADSYLGQRCEVLSIILKNRSHLLNLVKTMTNLRSINVQFEDDTWQFWHPLVDPSKVDELLNWLNNELPPSYSIRRNSKKTSLIQIWIGY